MVELVDDSKRKREERDIFENYKRKIFSKVDDSKRRRYLYLERRGIYLRIMRGGFLVRSW